MAIDIDDVQSHRPIDKAKEYFSQPINDVVFIRHDLSEAELKIARKRVRDGESLDAVADDFYKQITGTS
jgi:hypothetical protein